MIQSPFMNQGPRIYVSPERIDGSQAELDREAAKHLGSVLRLSVGDAVTLFDGLGMEYYGRIATISRYAVEVAIAHREKRTAESPVHLFLIQARPKANKMDRIVRQATELGVRRVAGVQSMRSVVQLNAKAFLARCKRWQTIAAQAARQCGRTEIPQIDKADTLEKALKNAASYSHRLLFHGSSDSQNIKSLLKPDSSELRLALAIGPEGGFAPDEVRLALEQGFRLVDFGPRILRTETAAIAALTAIQMHLGDMG